MSNTSLPARPSLEQLKNRAKELLIAVRSNDFDAVELFARHHPVRRLENERFALHDAQLVLARPHGFPNWTQLKEEVERRASDFSQRADRFVLDSGQFAANTRELSALFWYGDGEIDEALEAIAGWWLQALREDDGELIATAESHRWRSEAACRAFAGRLRQKMPEVKVNIYEEPRGWSVEIMPPGMILRDSLRGAS